jgi:hypothetical protein
MAETKNPGRELAGSAGAEENSSDANPTGGSGQAAHPAVAFLRLLGKDPRQTYFRTLQRGTATNDGRGGRDLLGFDLPALTRNNTSQGIFFITGNAIGASGINKQTGKPSGCVADKDCPTVPALFVEWDDKPIEWQVNAWRELGLPEPSLQIHTGGKSVHNYWVLAEPTPAAEWKVLQRRLLAHCGADPSICNPSRLMRLPGFSYFDKETGKPTDAVTQILHSSTTRYSAAEIEVCLPPVIEPAAATPAAAPPPPHRSGELPPRTWQEIEAAAACIPRRIGGQGTYDSDRNALCGCSAALAEAGSSDPDGDALTLLGDHWPDRKEAEQVLRSTTTRNAASFWAIARDNGYELKRQGPQPQTLVGGQSRQRPQAGDDTRGHQREKPSTTEEKLALLRQQASELLANRAPYAERLPILRAAAEDFDITIRDAELQAMLTAARRARTGSDHAINPGEWLDVAPTPWIWDGIFMRGCLNLLVAMPKQGKTSLVLSYIAAHHRREPAFLDRTLPGACPPVLIVGTDQGENDWGRMLEQAGLGERQGDRVRITEPLVGLHHAGRPLHLDPAGIDSIAAHAQQHPGLLIVIDSLAACVAPLGLKEESAQIADPIHDLMEQVEPHDATVVLIHHASKGHAGEGASMASRGSTALPAVASQTIKLGSATAGGSDPRRLLSTEGRGGAPLSLVIQREGGSWDYIGTAESLQQEQAETDVRKSLNDRQADALELVWERWEDQMARTTAANLVEGLGITGRDPSVYALKTLKQLERKGFLLSIQSKAGERTGGRPPYEFWPKGVGEISSASRIGAGGLPQTPEETEETAITPLAPEDPHRELSLFSSLGEVSSVSSVSSDHFEELGGTQETQEETGKNLTSLPERHKAPSLAPWHPIALGIHAEHPDWHPHQIALHLGQGFERINGRDVKALLEARP